jgi:hypothetical protein
VATLGDNPSEFLDRTNASTCDAEASARLATPNARDRKPPKRSTKLRTLGTLSGANDGASDAEIRAS